MDVADNVALFAHRVLTISTEQVTEVSRVEEMVMGFNFTMGV